MHHSTEASPKRRPSATLAAKPPPERTRVDTGTDFDTVTSAELAQNSLPTRAGTAFGNVIVASTCDGSDLPAKCAAPPAGDLDLMGAVPRDFFDMPRVTRPKPPSIGAHENHVCL